jgi:hypothetical protein
VESSSGRVGTYMLLIQKRILVGCWAAAEVLPSWAECSAMW